MTMVVTLYVRQARIVDEKVKVARTKMLKEVFDSTMSNYLEIWKAISGDPPTGAKLPKFDA